MSLEIIVYTPLLSDDLIPKIVKRLNDFEMICEVSPNFSFLTQTGFLPFKFQLTNPPFEIIRDKELISGFEIFIEDFNLETEKNKTRPKQTFIDKWINKKPPAKYLVSNEIDKRLQDCQKSISFIWHVGDSFELRFASLTSAILTELTKGVCTYPADNIWYDNENFVEKTWQEIKDYETSYLKVQDLKFHEFTGWNS